MLDMLLVPITLEEEAFELINSTGKVDTADNNKNFHEGKYKLLLLLSDRELKIVDE
jgi:hypothetical protein